MTTGITRLSGRSPAGSPPAPQPQTSNRASSRVRARTAGIIDQVLADDRRIRRLLGALDDAVRYGGEPGANRMLAEVWGRLAELLELRAGAWKEICHLALSGPGQAAAAQLRDVAAGHEDICEAVREARLHSAGSAAWWRAVTAALRLSDHLTRGERGALAVSGRPDTPAPRHGPGQRAASTAASAATPGLPRPRPPRRTSAGRRDGSPRGLVQGTPARPAPEGGQAGAPGPARLPINVCRATADIPFIIPDQFRPHHSPGVFHAFH